MVCLQFKTIDEVTRALQDCTSLQDNVTSIQQRHGPCRVLGEIRVDGVLKINNPGIYLKEVQEELFNVCGNVPQYAGQKMKRVAIQQSNALRAQ